MGGWCKRDYAHDRSTERVEAQEFCATTAWRHTANEAASIRFKRGKIRDSVSHFRPLLNVEEHQRGIFICPLRFSYRIVGLARQLCAFSTVL